MKTISLAPALAIGLAAQANAILLDLADGTFSPPSVPSDGQFQVADWDVGGVTFTFTSTDILVGAERWLQSNMGAVNGFRLGGGGSTLDFTLNVDMDVTLHRSPPAPA